MTASEVVFAPHATVRRMTALPSHVRVSLITSVASTPNSTPERSSAADNLVRGVTATQLPARLR